MDRYKGGGETITRRKETYHEGGETFALIMLNT